MHHTIFLSCRCMVNFPRINTIFVINLVASLIGLMLFSHFLLFYRFDTERFNEAFWVVENIFRGDVNSYSGDDNDVRNKCGG